MLSLVVNSLSLNLGAAPAPRVARAGSLSMMAGTATLNPDLTKTYPRDFAAVPFGTAYGEGADEELNKKEEDARLEAKLAILKDNLKTMVETRDRPIFTTALIAGDCVIMDVIMKMGYADKIKVIFIDTFFLFEESIAFMKETEEFYGFKANWYHCADCADAEEFYGAPPPPPPPPPAWPPPAPSLAAAARPDAHRRPPLAADKYGEDYWMQDLEDYDKKCKVEPLQRAMKEANTDAWINGRRRDHGAERASLPVWEGNKVNLLAHWSFEECWNYLRKYNVPYHPLHDVGFSSLGDVQVARPPPRPAPPRPRPDALPLPRLPPPRAPPTRCPHLPPPASRRAPRRCRSRSG